MKGDCISFLQEFLKRDELQAHLFCGFPVQERIVNEEAKAVRAEALENVAADAS